MENKDELSREQLDKLAEEILKMADIRHDDFRFQSSDEYFFLRGASDKKIVREIVRYALAMGFKLGYNKGGGDRFKEIQDNEEKL